MVALRYLCSIGAAGFVDRQHRKHCNIKQAEKTQKAAIFGKQFREIHEDVRNSYHSGDVSDVI